MDCPESSDGKHEVDDAEVETIDDEDKTATIAFFCALCGAEGRVVVKLSKIKWEED